ncbi:uncharacterized protein LOC105421897 [Amborella trichopoda]|uniref:uncharacterized protein LOC105421897 n=1 Tax=Amborella trichopoda TaxID=13333 RepID=UPI0005D2E33A|nr:uncharacterized protein LOC105421897 [Amborella trichopoda]|eukprot:XP_011629272.1 uncharacterized protein LOC105421897 [Amborella trichopoda]
MANFVWYHIIYQFGVLDQKTSNNGPQFKSQHVDFLVNQFGFPWKYSTMYYPRAKGLAEAFNKTLCGVLRKLMSKLKKNWHDKLPEALWVYCTTTHNATNSTPYSLVYGGEAVLPLEIKIPSLRVALHQGLTEDERVRLRYQELDALDEKRLEAQQNLKLNQTRMKKAFNKSIKVRSFTLGDLVLGVKRPIVIHRCDKEKFEPKWEGPFVIKKVTPSGVYILMHFDGEEA